MDRQRGSEVLTNSDSDYLQLSVVASLVVAIPRWRRRDKSLSMTVHHPYYLVTDLSDRLLSQYTKHV